MKKCFLKLLLISSICLSASSNMVAYNSVTVLANETQNIANTSNKLDVKFFIHEGDIIVAKVLIDNINNYNITDATISDDSILIDIVDGQVELYNLKPETNYKNLSITLTDSDNNTVTFKLNDFKTPNYNFLGYCNVKIDLHNGDFVGNVDVPQFDLMNIQNIKSLSISNKNIEVNLLDETTIRLNNLNENKTYSDLVVTIVSQDNKTYTLNLNPFTVPSKEIESLDVKVSAYKNNFSGEVVLPSSIYPMSAQISNKNVLIDVSDGKITILELKPNTTYTNLTLTVVDDQNNKHTFKLNNFTTVNKNFSYVDIRLSKNNGHIFGKVLLPNDLIIKDAKFSDTSLEFIIDKETNELTISNLKPDTSYHNLKAIVQDTDNKLHNFVINEFSTSIANVDFEKLSSYIENAYEKAFDRTELDKNGFKYWFDQLCNSKTSAKDFILNLLNTDEFIKIAKTPIDKINRIYNVMYNRTPDIAGLEFWIQEYENDFKITKDEKKSVKNIVIRMVEGTEFKNIIESIGIKY